MALFLLCANLGWIQGQFNFTEVSLRYLLEGVVLTADDRTIRKGIKDLKRYHMYTVSSRPSPRGEETCLLAQAFWADS